MRRAMRVRPSRAVVDGVHAGHHRQQHLRGADVGGGLLAADVLLARLQRQAVGGLALRHRPTRRSGGPASSACRRPAGHEGGVRAAETERHAEALRVADDDVRAPFAGRGDQRQREQVGGDGDQRRRARARRRRAPRSRRRRRRCPGTAAARRSRRASRPRASSPTRNVDAERLGARAHHVDRLRMARRRRRRTRSTSTCAERLASVIASAAAVASSSSEALAISMPVRSAHHGLEVEQRFQAALRDLRLVRRVGRVPGRVLEDVAQDDVRRVRAVVALADEAA